MRLRGMCNHFTVQQTSLETPLFIALPQLKSLCLVPISCQCMPTSYGASTHSLITNAFALDTALQQHLLIFE